MSLQEKTDYQVLSYQVRNDNEVESALKEGYEILKKVKEKGNEKLYTQFKQEYIDLEKSIQEAIRNDQIISTQERAKIISELTDIILLAEKEKITWKKWFFSTMGDVIKWTNTEAEKQKVTNFWNKDINSPDWTYKEVRDALDYTNKIYSSKPDGFTAFDKKSISELTDKKDINIFQEKLIEKTFWKGHKGYDKGQYLMAFSSWLWNYITTVPIIEEAIKKNDFQNIWNLAIRSYLNYLEWTWKLTKEYIVRIFWIDKAKEILNFIEKNKDKNKEVSFLNYENVIKILKEASAKVVKTIEELKNAVSDFFNKILESKTPQELEKNLEWIKNMDTDKQSEVLKLLKNELEKETSELKDMFLQPLLKKWIPKKEAEKKVKEIIEIINKNLTPQKIWIAIQAITKFSTDNKVPINHSKVINQASSVASISSKIRTTEAVIKKNNALKSWDKSWAEEEEKKIKAEKLNLQQLAATQIILENTTDLQFQQIWEWTLDYKTHLKELRKNNEVLDEELKNLVKEEKKIEKKDQEENLDKNLDNNQSSVKPTQFAYPDGTNINFTQATSWEYLIKTEKWNIEVNAEEFEIIKDNKEALNNMIHFRETLQELNLEGLFKYRHTIFKSISNTYTLAFNTKDDYLNKSELTIFIKAILQSVWQTSKVSNNIEDLKSEVKNINKVWVIWWQKDVNIYGDSFIENKFIEKFDPKRTSILDQNTFEKSLNNLS